MSSNKLNSKETSKHIKPKLEFSQTMCIRSWRLMAISIIFCIGGEFFLQYTGRGSMSEIVSIVLSLISFVTVFINGGYITQNIFRDTSLNKHGLRVDNRTKQKYYVTTEPVNINIGMEQAENSTEGYDVQLNGIQYTELH